MSLSRFLSKKVRVNSIIKKLYFSSPKQLFLSFSSAVWEKFHHNDNILQHRNVRQASRNLITLSESRAINFPLYHTCCGCNCIFTKLNKRSPTRASQCVKFLSIKNILSGLMLDSLKYFAFKLPEQYSLHFNELS